MELKREFCLVEAFWSYFDQNQDKDFLFFSDKTYSFSDFSKEVFKYYQFIKERGVQNRIGFYSNDDFESYCRLFGIALSGASYVPISLKWPHERIDEVVSHSRLDLILDDKSKEDFNSDGTRLPQLIDQEEAYVLFTSGSTGKPKGVPLKKSNINALRDYYRTESTYEFSSDDRFLQTFELHFDFSLFPLLMSVENQGSLHVLDFEGNRILQTPDRLEKDEITVFTSVPSILIHLEKYMSEFSFPGLKYSIFGGAPLYHSLKEKWEKCLPNGAVRNVYGPTETGVICSDYEGNESSNGIVAMGYLFPSFEYKIIDQELCLSGPQVFDGYLDTSLNRFIEIAGKSYYRTGDKVEMSDDGLMFFMGRVDFQIKHEGFRIEPEEVESRIKNALDLNVQLVKHEEDLYLLVEGEFEEQKLRENIKRNFPSYMLPRFIVGV